MPDAQSPKRPTTLNALSSAIASAATSRNRVRITGAGSFPLITFEGDARPVQPISMLRLNKVVEHAVADMTVIVQAGISLEALQRELAWRDQWLPVDPPLTGGTTGSPSLSPGLTPGSRTIGGLIATNSLGPLRFGCGDWRLLIMGMRWIDAGGRILKGGGRTVKNVAGYSTPRLMIGSCGSLGTIAEVALRTFARPADERSMLFYCANDADAEHLLASVMTSPTTPAYIQLIGGLTFSGNPLDLPPMPAGGMAVLIGFLGQPEVCAAQADLVRTLPAASHMETISLTGAQSGRMRLWMSTEPVAPAGGIGFRITVKSSAAAAVVGTLEQSARAAGGSCWIVSEAGNGIIRGVLSGTGMKDSVAALTAAKAGHVTWTQGSPSPASQEVLYRRLKNELDPKGIYGDVPL